jgi:hypothetical protein
MKGTFTRTYRLKVPFMRSGEGRSAGAPVNEPGPRTMNGLGLHWPLGETSQGNRARPGVVPDPAAGWCP